MYAKMSTPNSAESGQTSKIMLECIFVNMSRESLLGRPEVEAMRQRQLQSEDQSRELNFRLLNMDDGRVNTMDDSGMTANPSAHFEQLDEFVAERKRLSSMVARFSLSMRPEYLNMTIAEIGATTEAQCPDAIDTLKGEYRALLDSLQHEKLVDGEFARESTMASRVLSLVAPDDQFVILARTRILTTGKTKQAQNFALGKRMVFALPGGAWNAVQARGKNMDESEVNIVEQMLDQNDQHIIPIRTAYYRLRDLQSE